MYYFDIFVAPSLMMITFSKKNCCIFLIGISSFFSNICLTKAQETDAVVSSPIDADLLLPISSEQVRSRFAELEGNKFLRQTIVAPTDDPDHISVEELDISPELGAAKWVRKTVVGNSKDLSFSPSALDIPNEEGKIITPDATLVWNPNLHKWGFVTEKMSLSSFDSSINKIFLETSAPFYDLLKMYAKEYIRYQSMGNVKDATDALRKCMKIKHPGSEYTFETFGVVGTKHEYSFYPNGIVQQLKYITNNKLSGIVTNVFDSVKDGSLFDEQTKMVVKAETSMYQKLMQSAQAKRQSDKRGLGLFFDVTPEGLKVVNVARNSPALKAGLQPTDIVIEAQGKSTVGLAATDALALFKADEINMKVKEADGKILSILLKKVKEAEMLDEIGGFEMAYPQ